MRPSIAFLMSMLLAAGWAGEASWGQNAAGKGEESIRPDVIEKALRATVVIRTAAGQGSGFFVSRDGFLLTNAHVLSGMEKAEVETKDGKRYPIQFVAGFSLKQDLMLVKVEGQFEFLELEDAKKVKVGDTVFDIGHPYGHNWTMSKGYVAGKREEDGRPIIQVSSDISPGNSGGPILTAEGKVCGIATYLERRKIQFADGSYAMDPSSVLKFGISVEAFASVLQNAKTTRVKLSDVAELEKQAMSASVAAGILEITHELLAALGEGIGELTVEKVRDTPDSPGGRRRSARSGTTAVIGNAGPFVYAANRFRALGVLLNRYAPDSVKDDDVRQFSAHWRLSMAAANDAINAVVATDGASGNRVTKMSKNVNDSFKESRAEMYKAVLSAEKLVTKRQAYLPAAETILKKMRELKDLYKNVQ